MSNFLKLFFFLLFIAFPFFSSKTSILDFLTLSIWDHGIEYQILCQGSQTLKDCFLENQISLEKGDITFPSLETPVHQGMKIYINRSKLIHLNYFGKKSEIYTHKERVDEFLKEQNIKLSKNDLINVKLDDFLYWGMEIMIKKKPPQKKELLYQIGLASWYSFIPGDFTASRFFKKGTKLLVTNLSNQKSIVVTVNDYGPQPFTGRILDLEKNAFAKLAPLSLGVIKVKIQKL